MRLTRRNFVTSLMGAPVFLTSRTSLAVDRWQQTLILVELNGGNDGLSFYRCLLREAPLFLQPGGYLLLEMGEGQAHRIAEEAENFQVWTLRNIRQDHANIDRIMTLERKR